MANILADKDTFHGPQCSIRLVTKTHKYVTEKGLTRKYIYYTKISHEPCPNLIMQDNLDRIKLCCYRLVMVCSCLTQVFELNRPIGRN